MASWLSRLYDGLEGRLRGARSTRSIGAFLAVAFLASLVVIEIARRGLLPDPVADFVPRSHFHAIDFAFTALMLFEVMLLVLALAHSVTASAGKQFEILSLILLRQSFKELTLLEGQFAWDQASESVLRMLSDSAGALVVFFLLGVFYRVRKQRPITDDASELEEFVRVKKAVALVMLIVLFGLLLEEAYLAVTMGKDGIFPFFESFYTLLIFSDVLIVLISLRYSSTYAVVFRNSGFAVATVLIRLALSAPPYVNAGLAVASMLFALGLLVAYNRFRAQEAQGAEHGTKHHLTVRD